MGASETSTVLAGGKGQRFTTTAPWRFAMKILYDKSGAAEILSMSEDRVDRLRRAGKLIAVLDGREYKYRADDLQRYADSLQVSA